MGSAKRKMRSVGTRVARNAKRMSRVVVAAAGAAGAAMAAFAVKSVQAAAKFEKGMTKVSTLVGLSSERVRGMRDDVLSLAAETGQAPTKLADALFRLTSGGIRGADVMDSLRKAAQGARIGMGDVAVLTRLATSTVQAFKSQGDDLNDVLNTMFFTIREGNVRVDRLTSAMGTVQSVAANAGITIEDLGAFLAVTSRTMNDTGRAARGLRQFLARLADAPKNVEEAMQAAGTSVDEFRRAIRERGLPAALTELAQAAERNDVEFAKLVGSAEALPPLLAAARNNADDFIAISNRMPQAQGAFRSAIDETAKTLADLIDRTRATWQAFKINFGDRLAPLANDLLNSFRQNMPQIGAVVARAMSDVLGAVQAVINFFDGATKEIATGGLVGFLFMGPQGAAIGGLIGKLIAENTIRLKQALDLLPGKEVEFNPLEKALIDAREIRREMVATEARIQRISSRDEGGLVGGPMAPAGFDRAQKVQELNDRLRELSRMLSDAEERAQQAMQEGFTAPGEKASDTVRRLNDLIDKTQRRLDKLADTGFGGFGREAGETAGKQFSAAFMRALMGGPSPFGVLGQFFGRGAAGGGGGPQSSPGFGGLGGFTRGGGGGGASNRKARQFSRSAKHFEGVIGDTARSLDRAGDEGKQGVTVFQGITSALSRLQSVAGGAISKILSVGAAIANAVSKILQGASTGGIIGAAAGVFSAFAGAFAHGGSIPTGQFGIVGEAGPEVVTGPAQVQPVDASMAGAGGTSDLATLLANIGPVSRWALANDPQIQALRDAESEVRRQTTGRT